MTMLRVKSNILLYMFTNSEKLTLAINCLYSNRNTRYLGSDLYIYDNKYYLSIKKSERKNLYKIEEFSDKTLYANQYISILKEYGKQLISRNAIFVYGKAFAKYF